MEKDSFIMNGNIRKVLEDFAKRITINSHFERTGGNVHRVIEVEVAINVFRETIENLQYKS